MKSVAINLNPIFHLLIPLSDTTFFPRRLDLIIKIDDDDDDDTTTTVDERQRQRTAARLVVRQDYDDDDDDVRRVIQDILWARVGHTN